MSQKSFQSMLSSGKVPQGYCKTCEQHMSMIGDTELGTTATIFTNQHQTSIAVVTHDAVAWHALPSSV